MVRQNCVATEDLGMTISGMSDLQERWAIFFGMYYVYNLVYFFLKSIHSPLGTTGPLNRSNVKTVKNRNGIF